MFAHEKPVRQSMIAGLACLAGASGPAWAQDCKLSVQATPQVLYGGQSAGVNVFAHFPSPPAANAPYAFASAEFDIHATDPAWTFATAGAIVGGDVLGINVGQPHAPQTGNPADPSNPYGVWHGTFTPQSNAPALVEIAAADPTEFWVYPSKLTSSPALRDAEGGNDWLFVNPRSAGGWVAAPGAGTEIEIHDDVIIDGRIITGENWDSACIGLLPAAHEFVSESSARVAFYGQPVTFTATVQGHDAQRSRVTSLAVTFSGLESGSGHMVGANFALADGSVHFIAYEGFLGGVRVAAGDLEDAQVPGLVVDSLPQTIGARVGTGTLILSSANTYRGLTTIAQYDRPITAMVRGADGRPRTVTLDTIEVHGNVQNAARISSANNLKQMSLGCHVMAAAGVQRMTIMPRQPE